LNHRRAVKIISIIIEMTETSLSEMLRLGADYQYDTDFVSAQMHTLRLRLQGKF
jgi:hypothetical protein